MLWLILLFTPAFAVRLRDVKAECDANPLLPFCDSHLLGVPKGKHDTVGRHSVGEGKKALGFSTEQQMEFLTWLDDVKSDDPEDSDESDLETVHHSHADVGQYCGKYRNNYRLYCKDNKAAELEGVLNQFCAAFKKTCPELASASADLAVTSSAPQSKHVDDDFPRPGRLRTLSSVGVDSAESETEPASKFTGSTSQYCKSFADNYHKLCDSGETSSKDLNEFCESYSQNCGVEKKAKSESAKSSKGGDDEDLETFEIEDPPENNEISPKSTSNEVKQYCSKYKDNYNYFCAGESGSDNADFCNAYKTNCPDAQGSLQESASFLGGGAGSSRSGSGGEKGNGKGDSLFLYKGDKKDYCDRFSVNYQYYCIGDTDNPEITAKFCPSYKASCLGPKAATPVQSSRPSNPFTKQAGRIEDNEEKKQGGEIDAEFPDFDNPGKSRIRRTTLRSYEWSEEEFTSGTRKKGGGGGSSRGRGRGRGRGGKRQRRKVPCTPECDQRRHPHCTADCKCDYSYPYVQKFCNPPPLPMFLNTCRLWYNGCPKYERYHYSSQFVYSKAEKGKRVEGPVNSRPFNLQTPSGEKLGNVVVPSGGGGRLKDHAYSWADDELNHIRSQGYPGRARRSTVTQEGGLDPSAFEFEEEEKEEEDPISAQLRLHEHDEMKQHLIEKARERIEKPTFAADEPIDIDELARKRKGKKKAKKEKKEEPKIEHIFDMIDKVRKKVLPDPPSIPDQVKDAIKLIDKPTAPWLHLVPGHEDKGLATAAQIPTVNYKTSVKVNDKAFFQVASPNSSNGSAPAKAKEKKKEEPYLPEPPPLPDDVPKDLKQKDESPAVPVVASDSVFNNPSISGFGAYTDSGGLLHRPRSRSPFTKPGLWEPNPDNPHNRDHANKWYYHPRSVNVDWLSGQIAWGAHWAVPAAGVGGTDGFSTVHFPTIGTFASIPDDYD